MRIGSGLSQIDNLYITPMYPQKPVQPVQKVRVDSYDSVFDLGSANTMKAMNYKTDNITPSNIMINLPDGKVIVGLIVDTFA